MTIFKKFHSIYSLPRTKYLLCFLLLSLSAVAQREVVSFYSGLADKNGVYFKCSYGNKFKNLVKVGGNLSFLRKGLGEDYIFTLYDKNTYSYELYKKEKELNISQSSSFVGLSVSLNALNFLKNIKRHELYTGISCGWRFYETNINILKKDVAGNNSLYSLLYKKNNILGLDYSIEYSFRLNKKISLGGNFDIITYDKGNVNALSIFIARRF